jgi:hypothetical protein
MVIGFAPESLIAFSGILNEKENLTNAEKNELKKLSKAIERESK